MDVSVNSNSTSIKVRPLVNRIAIAIAKPSIKIGVEAQNVIEIKPTSFKVAVPQRGIQGPPGKNGLKGDTGTSGAGFEFRQALASDLWIINHNLGFYPGVALYTDGGLELDGTIVNASLNQVLVYFNSPISGTARCI